MIDDDNLALVICDTSKGPFTLKLIRKWSPLGYDRAVDLFERRFYDRSHFFRVLPGFLVQFGISYTSDEEVKKIARTTINDDPQLPELRQFHPGLVSFAGGGENSRGSQLFISYGSTKSLGTMPWETPIGEVVDGLEETIKKFNSEYKEAPKQGRIHSGRDYIEKEFPNLDYFKTCTVKRIKANAEDKGEHVGNKNSINDDSLDTGIHVKRPSNPNTGSISSSLRLGSTVSSQIRVGNNRIFIFAVVIFSLVAAFTAKKKLFSSGRTKRL